MKKDSNEFLDFVLKSGRIKPLEDAFNEFPVEEEDHKGNAYCYVRRV